MTTTTTSAPSVQPQRPGVTKCAISKVVERVDFAEVSGGLWQFLTVS